jgi:hypothetical protein
VSIAFTGYYFIVDLTVDLTVDVTVDLVVDLTVNVIDVGSLFGILIVNLTADLWMVYRLTPLLNRTGRLPFNVILRMMSHRPTLEPTGQLVVQRADFSWLTRILGASVPTGPKLFIFVRKMVPARIWRAVELEAAMVIQIYLESVCESFKIMPYYE